MGSTSSLWEAPETPPRSSGFPFNTPPFFLKRRKLLWVLLLFIAASGLSLHGQDTPGPAGPVLLAEEIQRIEKNLNAGSLSGAGRRESLSQLARLFRLAGNIEAAAQAWTDAAFAEPGRRDDTALIEGARCLAALGEFDKAGAGVNTVLLTGREAPSLLSARLLGAQIEAFRTGNPQLLASLLDNPDYGDQKPVIYYTLWKISASETYKNRLIAEYPASPEARIAGDQGSSAVSASPSALWFFFPGRESLTLSSPAGGTAGGGTGERRPLPDTAGPPSVDSGSGETGPRALQTGLFGREENARAMAGRLRTAGFTPAVVPRRVNDADYWAVTVPPGTDSNRTILQLKEAGFESFPVF